MEYTKQFALNVARWWQDLDDVIHQKRLQKLVLPEGFTYNKTDDAICTTALSPIFELNRSFGDGESDLVAG